MSPDPAAMILPSPLVVLWAALVHLAAWGAGDALLARTRALRTAEPGVRAAVAAGLGLVVLAEGAFVLGLCRLLHAAVLLAAVAALALLGGARLARARPRWRRPRVAVLPLVVAGAFYLSFLPYALNPVLHHDDATYHLRIPWWYLAHGGLEPDRGLLFANMPHLVEVLHTVAMAIGDLTAPKLVVFGATGWILVGLASWARPRAGTIGAGLVLLVFLSGKGVQWHLGPAYVEPVLALWLFGAIMTVLAWRAGSDRRDLVLAGLLVGAAAASKYTAWLFGAAVGAAVLALAWRRRREVSARRAVAAFALPALLIVFPWLVRAAVLVGNPLYPNLPEILGGDRWSPLQQAQYEREAASVADGLAPGRARVAYPVLGTFGDDLYDAPSASIALFAALGLAVPLAWRRRGEAGLVTAVAWAGLLAWAAGPPQGRYLVAWMPVLALPAVVVVASARDRPARQAVAACAILAAGAWQLAAQRYPWSPPWAALGPARASLLVRNPTWELSRRLVATVPPGGRVLALWENRFVFLPRAVDADSVWQAPSGLARLRAAGSPARFARALREEGVDRVVVHVPNLQRYFGPGWEFPIVDPIAYPADVWRNDRELLDAFLGGETVPVEVVGPYAILRLRPEVDGSRGSGENLRREDP